MYTALSIASRGKSQFPYSKPTSGAGGAVAVADAGAVSLSLTAKSTLSVSPRDLVIVLWYRQSPALSHLSRCRSLRLQDQVQRLSQSRQFWRR